MALKLPKGTDAVFRIVETDAFGNHFAINVYGNGRDGWFVATRRNFGRVQDSGAQQLPKGEWATLLHLIEMCGFWSLPEDDSHLINQFPFDDGEFLTISGRDASRYHGISRFVERDWGLDAVLRFGMRISGFFERRPDPDEYSNRMRDPTAEQ